MHSLNRCEIIGNVGADPDIREIGRQGETRRVANFSVATSEKYKKRDGTVVERTEWHRVTCWAQGVIDKVIAPHLRKGAKVFVAGKLQTRTWDDPDGVKRYMTEIVLSDFQCELLLVSTAQKAPYTGASGDNRENTAPDPYTQDRQSQALDDEIPF